jgi:hypothetical protein
MSIPSSSDLYEAGLVAGVTFVAEFWHFGRWCIAIPSDFYVRHKTPDSLVKCVFTGKQKTYGQIANRLSTGACTAVVLPSRVTMHPCVVQTPVWVKTSSQIMSM